MSTYQDLQNRIAADLSRDDLTSQIQSAIGDAIAHYAHDRFWFNVTRSKTFVTIGGQPVYGAGQLPEIPDIIELDHLFLSDAGTVTELDFYEVDKFEWLSGSNSTPGKPTAYTRADGQIFVYPVPNTSYTLRPQMHYRLPALTVGTDTNAWCNEAEQLIRTHAKLILYADVLEDAEGMQRMQSKIGALKDRLDAETVKRTSARSTGRVTGTPAYQDLLDRIASDLGRSDMANKIHGAVRDAIKHFEHDRFWFNVTQSKTFSTVVGQQTYGAAALAEIPGIIKLDHLFLPLAGSIAELDFYEVDQFEWISANATRGKPTCYTRTDGQIALWPVPNAVYTLRPHMHYRLPALSNPTDTNAWCNEAEELIRTHAKLLLYTDALEDAKGAQRMLSKIDGLKSKLGYETSSRAATGRIIGTNF